MAPGYIGWLKHDTTEKTTSQMGRTNELTPLMLACKLDTSRSGRGSGKLSHQCQPGLP